MIGPVFVVELVRAARRGNHHRVRLACTLTLALEAGVLFLLLFSRTHPVLGAGDLLPAEQAAWLVTALQVLLVQQFVVVLLAAPGFAAGTLTDEKAAGTLQHLLTTPLEAREIIQGKFLALLVVQGGLALPAVPLIVLLAGFLRLPIWEILLLIGQPLLPLAAVTAASLLASVWARRTPSAVLRLYLVLAGLAVAAWLGGAWPVLGPLVVLEAEGSAQPVRALLLHAAVWGGPVVPCLLLAAWRLRPAYRAQLPGETLSGRTFLWRPVVGRQPIRWKERWLAERTLPLVGSLPRPVGLALVVVWTLLVFGGATLLSTGAAGLLGRINLWGLAALLGLAVACLAGSLVAVRCAGSVTGERERQTWDLLLLTPLETRTLLRGKAWGALDAARPYLLAYLIAAAPLAACAGPGALVAVVLVWLWSWPFLFFVAVTAVSCSVKATATWRGLVAALQASSRGMTPFLFVFLGPGACLSPAFVGNLYAYCAFLAVALAVTGFLCLARAAQQLDLADLYIADHERVSAGGERRRLRKDG